MFHILLSLCSFTFQVNTEARKRMLWNYSARMWKISSEITCPNNNAYNHITDI